MAQIEDETILCEAIKRCEFFIQQEQRNLTTFTKDSNLRYLPETSLQRICFKPKEGVVYLPIERFLDEKIENHDMLWHLYYELALYSEWKHHPNEYLFRLANWQQENNRMTTYLLKKVKEEGKEKEPSLQPSVLSLYIEKEISCFLATFDNCLKVVKVQQQCPIYRAKPYKNYVNNYLRKQWKTLRQLEKLPLHRAFIDVFQPTILGNQTYLIWQGDKDPFEEKINGQHYQTFILCGMVQSILEEETINQRDEFIKSFVYPTFERLWKLEIDNMSFGEAGEENDVLTQSHVEPEDEGKITPIESTDEEKEEQLKELLEQERDRQQMMTQLLDNKSKLEAYGVSKEEQEVFYYYSKLVEKERSDMRFFWESLIGNAKKEQSVKQTGQLKGKLDVNSLITNYVTLHEAEKTGNYKKLPVFSRYDLTPTIKQLPERIDIIFLIDNSGSMTESKIDAARKALTVTLLSLSDFAKSLKNHAAMLNQNICVTSETWLFGSHYYQVKHGESSNELERQKMIIQSITSINGQDGVTDDASCLKELLENMNKKEETELQTNHRMKLIIEITDGASSFPGATKKVLDKLLEKKVDVYSFQIGKNSEATVKTFDFIWKDRGIKVGEDLTTLPKQLLGVVGNQMKKIFN